MLQLIVYDWLIEINFGANIGPFFNSLKLTEDPAATTGQRYHVGENQQRGQKMATQWEAAPSPRLP